MRPVMKKDRVLLSSSSDVKEQQVDRHRLLFPRQLETVGPRAKEFVGCPGRPHETGRGVELRFQKVMTELVGQSATQCPSNQDFASREGGSVQPRHPAEHPLGGGSRQINGMAGPIGGERDPAQCAVRIDTRSPVADGDGYRGVVRCLRRSDPVPLEGDMPIERDTGGSPDGLRLGADPLHQRVGNAGRHHHVDGNRRNSQLTRKPQKERRTQEDHEEVL
jgi:hypothetical protein